MSGTPATSIAAAPVAAGSRGRLLFLLAIGGLAMLSAAGLVLWATQSEALFFAALTGALAGCF